jgi:hypothetical protein
LHASGWCHEFTRDKRNVAFALDQATSGWAQGAIQDRKAGVSFDGPQAHPICNFQTEIPIGGKNHFRKLQGQRRSAVRKRGIECFCKAMCE